jgi:hypothetical protein
MHCLYKIREHIFSPAPLNPNLREGSHTLHCIDYIRESLMCNADMTLQGTDNYLQYIKNNGHQCRDFAAVQGWVREHRWPGHRKYIDEWAREHKGDEEIGKGLERGMSARGDEKV